MDFQPVESGDLFSDNDPRRPGRVVQIRSASVLREGDVEAVIVEHPNEKRIGRHTWINLDRLQLGRDDARGYTKVER